MDDNWMERYSRQTVLDEIGGKGQERLSRSSVLVVGAGGLGAPALIYLVSAGIGRLGIVDGDRVELHNLPRQVVFGEHDIGKNKALAAAEFLRSRNGHCEVLAFPFMLTSYNVRELLSGFDIILDCTDNFSSRYIISDACGLSKKVCIHGALYRFEGQVISFNHADADIGYRSVVPESASNSNVTGCAENGMLGVVSGVIGTCQAAQAIQFALGLESVAGGKMYWMDLKSMSVTTVNITRDAEAEDQRPRSWKELLEHPYIEQSCESDIEIGIGALLFDTDKECLVDIRESYEREADPIEGALQVSLYDLDTFMEYLPLSKRLILVCENGIRSRIAARIVRSKLNHPLAFSLREGSRALNFRWSQIKKESKND